MNKFFQKCSFEPPVSSFCTSPSILTAYSSIPHSWIQWSLHPLSSGFKTFFHVFFFPIKIERHPETQIIYTYWLLIDYLLTYLWVCSMKGREAKWKSLSRVWLFATPWTILYSPWNSPGQNTGVGSLSLLQRIFPTQGSNPGLPHCRWILYQLSHKGSPGILPWVAYPFFSGSSWPRNQTGVSSTAGGFFANWATREAWVFHGA